MSHAVTLFCFTAVSVWCASFPLKRSHVFVTSLNTVSPSEGDLLIQTAPRSIAKIWAIEDFLLHLPTGNGGKEKPRLIFLQRGAETALSRGERECLCSCINISALDRYAPRARRRDTANPTWRHLALSCTHSFMLKHVHLMHTKALSHAALFWSTRTRHPSHLSILLAGWWYVSKLSVDAKPWIMDETSGQQRSARMMDADTKRDVERTADICLFLNPLPLIWIYVIAVLISISIEINQQGDTLQFVATKHLLRLQKTLFLLERYGVWQPEVVWPRVSRLHCLPSFLTSEPLTPCLFWSMNYSSTGTRARTRCFIP